MISILICTFNHGEYLSRCIDSILNQTCSDYEIIVVDDCSTDNTQEILKSYDIIKIRNDINKNLMESRKIAFQHSKGDFILFMDADDYLPSDDILSELSECKSDMTNFRFTSEDKPWSYVMCNKFYKHPLYFNSLIIKYNQYCRMIWTRLWKREVVVNTYKSLEITDSFMREDAVFVQEALKYVNSYDYLDKVCYYHSLFTGYSHNIDKLKSIGGRRGNLEFSVINQ